MVTVTRTFQILARRKLRGQKPVRRGEGRYLVAVRFAVKRLFANSSFRRRGPGAASLAGRGAGACAPPKD